jgi:hypothetical protein
MPDTWTAATISYYGSSDGTNFNACYDSAGVLINPAADAKRRIILTSENFSSMSHLKILSGTPAAPVNQGADRILYIELWD